MSQILLPPDIFALELRGQIISIKWLQKHFLWPINDKCFSFLRKWSHSFLSSVYFQCLVFFHSVPIWSPLKALCFQSSTVWLCCFLVLLLWCVFCQRKFTGTLAYLTDTMSHRAFLKKKLHVLLERFSLSLHVTLRLSPQYITMIRYKCKPLPVIGIALIPRLNSQVLSDYMVLQ